MRKLLYTLLLLATGLAASAQSTIKVNAPNLVGADEQFTLTFIIEGEHAPSDFSWEVTDDFQLVWGPQRGTSSSITRVNGKTTKSSQTTLTYVLLPKKTGTFQLPPMTADLKGEKISSKAITIQVVANGAGSQSSGSGQSSQSQQSTGSSTSVDNGDIYMRLILSKSRAVVGETISATLKLYQRVNIAGFEDAKFPTFNGFWSQQEQAPTNIEFRRENVGDMIYNTAVLRSWTLVPQQSGDIRIDPAELVCLVNVRAPRSSSNSVFDSFFQDDYRTIRQKVTTPAATVHVSPVPAGAPASFGGGVGSFKMSAALTRDSLQTHDAASLKVTITGRGNITLLEAPKVNFPPDFEVYDVKTTDAGGARTFEYPFIPRSHGDFVIGPVEYSYYDIQSGKYVTLTSEPMELRVGRGAETEHVSGGGQLVSGPARKDVKDLGSDIRSIATRVPSFRTPGKYFVASAGYWALFVLMLVLAAGAYLGFRRNESRRADVAGTRNRAAAKQARKRLSRAEEYLSKGLYSAFYEELHKALLGFVSDKLDMKGMEMSKDNMSLRLSESGVPEGLVMDFTSLVDACEYARYAPAEGNDAMNAHFEKAVAVISSIDQAMGRKNRIGAGAAAAVLALVMLMPFGPKAAAQSADSLWYAGAAAYADARWSDAADAWSAIEATGAVSSELYYNIGNAAFRNGDLAGAVINYERALKLDPSNKDAKVNLEFVRTRIQDKIDVVPEFFLKTWLRKACWVMSSNAWAAISLVLLAGALAMLLLFLLSGRKGARKTGFFAGIFLIILFIVCLRFAFWQRSDSLRNDIAVVTSPVVSVKSSPYGDGSTDLFVLHEGTELKIVDAVGEWYNIELADGRQGWISLSSVETIWK